MTATLSILLAHQCLIFCHLWSMSIPMSWCLRSQVAFTHLSMSVVGGSVPGTDGLNWTLTDSAFDHKWARPMSCVVGSRERWRNNSAWDDPRQVPKLLRLLEIHEVKGLIRGIRYHHLPDEELLAIIPEIGIVDLPALRLMSDPSALGVEIDG
ncbi:hypothetical protein B0O80DRAFT_430034 [Mortierella sp. GBAus27b]|nr:hypothetical protein B0O80DRAFT_430034 [Mortierella sp. GBAus27b]